MCLSSLCIIVDVKVVGSSQKLETRVSGWSEDGFLNLLTSSKKTFILLNTELWVRFVDASSFDHFRVYADYITEAASLTGN